MKGRQHMVLVERMSNLGDWELFRFADEETDELVCKMALRMNTDEGNIEYGVWRKDDPEPSATGRLEWGSEWNDEARIQALKNIAEIYAEGLPETRPGLLFGIGEAEDHDDLEDGDE